MKNTAIFLEVWKPVMNSRVRPGMYMVSNAGRVSNKKIVLKSHIINSGYEAVILVCKDGTQKTFLVHRLVAEAFRYREREEQDTVNHNDGIKFNNHYSNLDWMTQDENNAHARDNHLNNSYGENQHMAKLTEEKVKTACALLEHGVPYKEILSEINMKDTWNNRDLIGNIKRHKSWNYISKDYNF